MSQFVITDPVREWLGAYHDGELPGERRAWVESHLATCGDCQLELAELRALSGLLHAEPDLVPALTVANFATQVIERLPRASQPLWPRLFKNSLRFAPLGLFGIWIFFQVAAGVSSVLWVAASWFPPAQSALSALPFMNRVPESAQPGWLVDLLALLGQKGLAGTVQDASQALSALPGLDLELFNFAFGAVVSVLFAAWLAGLWAYRRSQAQTDG